MAVFDPDLKPSGDRGYLLTEQSNPRSSRLDQLSTTELVNLFTEEDLRPQQAVAAASPALAAAVDAISERLRNGGRLFYLGAGTSGRLVCSMPLNVLRRSAVIQRWCKACWPVVPRRCFAVLRDSRISKLPVALISRTVVFRLQTVLWGLRQEEPPLTCAVDSPMQARSALWRSPWPACQATRPPCLVTSISGC